ncbi:glycosyltransferase family 2 protein [Flavobacteriales bacterium]|nr:glycosyltransferase family 2 protein [Flavobacteriales bacterium]
MNLSEQKHLISVVVPVYRGKSFLQELANRIKTAIDSLGCDAELILIDDQCPDQSWQLIESMCKERRWIRGICLSRNFGQHNAITAGLAHSLGDWVVIMDCDLQDRPEEIPALYNKAMEGYGLVRALRKVRNDRLLKRWSSILFNRLFSYLTGTQKNPEIANFGIYKRDVVDAMLDMGDRIRFTPSLVDWVGFEEAQIEVQHDARSEGHSSYSWFKLFSLALDNAVAFSLKPLHLTLRLGFSLAFASLLMTAFYLYQRINGTIEVPGYASIIISIWFLSGVIISVLGIVGLYVGYAFMNTKSRPRYIVQNVLNQPAP